MKFSSGHLSAGVESVLGSKFRSFWTTLGVIIGVTSVITVISIGQGVKQQVSHQIHHLGHNIITIKPAQFGDGNDSSATSGSLVSNLGASGPLSFKDVSVISRAKGVAASAPLTITGGKISGDNGPYSDGFVIGTSGDLPGLLNQSMAYGSFFTSDDDGADVAVVGQHASEKLFNVDVPLGRSFTFHGEKFIVRGVFNQFSTTPLSKQADFNNAIFVPNDVIERLSKDTAPTYEVLVRPANAKQTDAAIASVKTALDKSHGGQSGFSVTSGNQNLASNNQILDLLTRMIAGVAGISLLVGGIGIMNVMLVSVAERLHEIGIRKAVGATNGQIMSQFLIESSLLSLIGGLIGVVLALLIDVALRVFTSLQPSLTWQTVLLATSVSLIVGIIFGTVPAIKAARKDPIEALRSE